MLILTLHFCMLYNLMELHLQKTFNEVPIVEALDEEGNKFIIFASPKGTWTAINVTIDKQACIITSGSVLTLIAPSKDI